MTSRFQALVAVAKLEIMVCLAESFNTARPATLWKYMLEGRITDREYINLIHYIETFPEAFEGLPN